MTLECFEDNFVWLRMPTDEEFDSDRHGGFFHLVKSAWTRCADRIYIASTPHMYTYENVDHIAYRLFVPHQEENNFSWPATHLDMVFGGETPAMATIAKPTSIAEYPKEFLGLSGDFLREHEGKEYKITDIFFNTSSTKGPYAMLEDTGDVRWPVCLLKRSEARASSRTGHTCEAVNIGFTSIRMACKHCGRDM